MSEIETDEEKKFSRIEVYINIRMWEGDGKFIGYMTMRQLATVTSYMPKV